MTSTLVIFVDTFRFLRTMPILYKFMRCKAENMIRIQLCLRNKQQLLHLFVRKETGRRSFISFLRSASVFFQYVNGRYEHNILEHSYIVFVTTYFVKNHLHRVFSSNCVIFFIYTSTNVYFMEKFEVFHDI